jgi:hypothetical protein
MCIRDRQVSVGDLKTEETASGLTALYPNGYPYLVIDDGYEVIVIDVNSDRISLEVQYGGKTLFSGTTRSLTDYKQAAEGISYTDGGHTYAILEAPSGSEVVKPIIKGSVEATGDVEVKVQQIKVKDKTQTGTALFDVVKDNSTTVPVPPVGETYVDTDGDWIYDIDDTDDDGDGIPDVRDPEPLIPGTTWINDDPAIINIAGPLEKVKEGESFTLSVEAEDTDGDPMTFTWTLSGSNWTGEGESTNGPTDLEPGTHTFTITVTDNKGGETVRTLDVEIEERKDEGEDNNWLIYLAVVAIVIVIIIVVVLFVRRGGDGESMEEDETEELLPEEDLEEPSLMDDEESEMMEEEESGILQEEEEMEEEDGIDVGMGPPLGESLIQEGEMEASDTVVGETCPHCNSPLEPTDSVCPGCGTEFDIELECPLCGEKVDQSMEVCPKCNVSFM